MRHTTIFSIESRLLMEYQYISALTSSQPKIDLGKLRSQISRSADVSFPVFARPVWHAGHADLEASWV